MINIIRSVNYTSRKNLAIIICLLSMLAVPVIVPLCIMTVPFKDITGGLYLINLASELILLWLFPIMILSCIAASGDAGDRTLNYEILTGHSRRSIYAARVLSGLFWGVLLTAFLFYLPLVYYGVINGWPGTSLKISDIVLRAFLSLFSIFRISAFCIMLSTLLNSAGKGICLSYLLMEVGIMIIEIIKEFNDKIDTAYLMGTYTLMDLLYLENSRDYVIDGKKVTVFETAVSGRHIALTIGISLFIGLLYLAVSYMYFTKHDRD